MSSYSLSKDYYSGVIPHPELDRWELLIYQKNLPRVYSLLDMGCGTGNFLELAIRKFSFVLGIDLNKQALKVCRQKHLLVFYRDATKTNFKSRSLDIVRAQNILEHLDSPEKLILEAKRILKKKGFLVLHVPTNFSVFYPITNFWDDYTHIRPFTKRGLYRLLSDFGFKITYFKGYTLGRNQFESLLGKLIEKFFPFNWFVIARKES